jgi:stage II sporulation protein D
MRKSFSCFLIVIMFLLVPSLTWASPLVRIGIINGKDNAVISGQRSFQIVDVYNGHTIATGQAGEKWYVTYEDGTLYLNGIKLEAPVAFRLEPGDENEYLTVNGRRYRGELEVRESVTRYGITVIETLPVEEYVYGIIAWEISPAWHVEAVKAQAVAARTYALYNRGKHSTDGFDLCNTVDCQVYGGREAEDPRGNWAVDATRGMVVTYQHRLVPTYFHSSSGGYTENSENVWGNYASYLRAVPDFDQNNPKYQWKQTYTLEQITKVLEDAGYNIGKLQGVELSPLHLGLNDAPDRGASGRVKSMTFVGSEQTVTLSGAKVRGLFKLNSTMFDVKVPSDPTVSPTSAAKAVDSVMPVLAIHETVAVKQPDVVQTTQQVKQPDVAQSTDQITKKKKKSRKTSNTPKSTQSVDVVKQPNIQIDNKAPTNNVESAAAKTTPIEPVVVKPVPAEPVFRPLTTLSEPLVFEGRGWGHGLGMSQWGAKAMAESCPKEDHTYYQQILKHYYQGVEIIEWY